MRRIAVILALAITGCADAGSSDDGTGTMMLGLKNDVGGWFRLRIQSTESVGEEGAKADFDTGCIDAKSRTYELQNVPAGDDFTIFIESYGSAQCTPESRAEVGYRGEVTIPEGNLAPYYHVPLFELGSSSAFPKNINISAAAAEPIDYCSEDSECAGLSDRHECHVEQNGQYWCLPTCEADADCTDYHPDASCDVSTNWCRLAAPYPLNMPSARAMGHAATLSDGSVAFIGGFTAQVAGMVIADSSEVDVFDATSGLFHRMKLPGFEDGGAGLSGFTQLDSNLFVVVGGVRSAEVTWSGTGSDRKISVGELAKEDCSSGTCLANIRDSIYVVDLNTGAALRSQLPLPVAMPTVLAVGDNQVLVAGGYAPPSAVFGEPPPEGGGEPSKKAYLVTIGSDGSATSEMIGEMTTARVGASAMCTDSFCTSVLIVGGNQGGNVAEVVTFGDGEPTFEPVSLPLVPDPLWAPQLCGGKLVAGSNSPGAVGGVSPVMIAQDGDSWSVEYLKSDTAVALPLFPAVAETPDGLCYVAGGIDAGGSTSTTIYQVLEDSVHQRTFEATEARLGAQAAVIGYGPLAGGVLIGGGVQLSDSDESSGGVRPVMGAEVLLP